MESIEIIRVARGESGCFRITLPQVSIVERVGTLPAEKVKSQPAAIRSRDALGFSKECHEQEKNEIGIHLGLQLQVTGKVFRVDLARAVLKLQGRMQRV